MPARQLEPAWGERVDKETAAWITGARERDPFAPTLASLVGGGTDAASTGAESVGLSLSSLSSHNNSRIAIVPRASRSKISLPQSSHLAKPEGSQLAKPEGSQLSNAAARSQLRAASSRSQLSSAGSSLSWRTPSTIRSSEPTEIARNKVAELQLRLELERVVRLQKEVEMENKRKARLLQKEQKSAIAGS